MDFTLSAPPEIIAALQDGRRSGGWIQTYCPVCDPDRRKRGRLTLRAGIFRGRPWWGCMRCQCQKDYHAAQKTAHLRAELQPRNEKQKRERALRQFENSCSIRTDDLVDRYFRYTRELPPPTAWWPSTLRTVTRMYHDLDGHDRLGGMVAAVQDCSGTIVACHRTYLVEFEGRVVKGDDERLPSRFRVSKARLALAAITGCAVRLGVDSEEIGVCEGIESALGLASHTGLVCWAAISANGMRELRVPKHVRRIVIGPDVGDRENVGMEAAHALRNRVVEEGKKRGQLIDVRILCPPIGKSDWGEQ